MSQQQALYSIAMMLYDTHSGEIITSHNITNRPLVSTFIHEFTPRTLEDIGTPVTLKLTDMTQYKPGMNRLCLNIHINNSDQPRKVAFRNNYDVPFLDIQERTSILRIPFYKSIVVQFDPIAMNQRGI